MNNMIFQYQSTATNAWNLVILHIMSYFTVTLNAIQSLKLRVVIVWTSKAQQKSFLDHIALCNVSYTDALNPIIIKIISSSDKTTYNSM